MSIIDELLQRNADYQSQFNQGSLPVPPAEKIAIVACMDARIETGRLLGLKEGDAHVIRNAGGVVTDDTIRSLAISQHLLGTESIMIIHHTDCGMVTFTDAELKQRLEEETGLRPTFSIETFPDVDEDVKQSIRRIKANAFVKHKTNVRGFVYDVATGKLNEVAE